MTDFPMLPQLEIGDVSSQFDEAMIWIDGHEEETITISCAGAGDLADRLIRYVNAHDRVIATLFIAAKVLQQFGAKNAAARHRQVQPLRPLAQGRSREVPPRGLADLLPHDDGIDAGGGEAVSLSDQLSLFDPPPAALATPFDDETHEIAAALRALDAGVSVPFEIARYLVGEGLAHCTTTRIFVTEQGRVWLEAVKR
jgi:hypothetical protein